MDSQDVLTMPDAKTENAPLENATPQNTTLALPRETVTERAAPPSSAAEEDVRELLQTYEREAQALGNDKRAAPLFYAQGRLWEDRLRQPRQAAACYQKAYQIDPTYAPVIQAARRLFAELGNWQMVAQLLEAEAGQATSPELAAAIHFERALIFEEKLNQPQKAREAYEQARKSMPQSFTPARMLYRHHLAAEEFLPAYEVLDAVAAEINDAPFRADFHRQLALLAGPRLKHPEVAAAHQRAVFERDPHDPEARAALQHEMRKNGQFEALANFLSAQGVKANDAATGAYAHYQAARIFFENLSDEARAVAELRAALTLQPNHLLAIHELSHILEAAQRWSELAELLEQELALQKATDAGTDAEELSARLYRIGQIYEERLGDEAQAVRYYRQVVEMRPTYLPALQALGKIYYKKAAWEELSVMYEAEILATVEPTLKTPKIFKLAEIVETKLKNAERAIMLYKQIVDLDPGYLPALKALGRLYGESGRFDELIAMYQSEIAAAHDDDERMSLLDKIAQIYEEKLRDSDRAIEIYKQALAINPSHLPTLRALGQLYARAERHLDLIHVNETEANLVNDQKQVIGLLQKNGEIYEEKLADKDQAIECYRKVLAIAPNYLPALKSLGRLYLQKGRWEDLIAMYRQEIEVTHLPGPAAALLFKIGELYAAKLVDEARAIAAYEEVLKLQPTHRQALAALGVIFQSQGLWPRLAEVYEREAELGINHEERAARWCKVAQLKEERIGDKDGAAEAYRQALAASPEHVPARQALVRLLEERGDYKQVCELLRREGESPSALRLEALGRLGQLAAEKLGDAPMAIAAYEKVIAQDPQDLSALLALERLYTEKKNYPKAIAVLEQLASRCHEPKLKIAYHLQAAAFKENHLEPPVFGLENYRAILQIEPRHAVSLRALEVHLHARRDWAALQEVLKAQMALARPDVQRALLVERAEIAVRVGKGGEDLLGPLEAIVAENPFFLPALRALRRLYQLHGNWAKFLALTEQEGRTTNDPARAAQLLCEVGRVQWKQMGDPARARETFAEALRRAPEHPGAIAAYVELLREGKDAPELARYLESLVGERGEYAAQAGHIFQQLGDTERAQRDYHLALERNPHNAGALIGLAEIEQANQDWMSAVEYYTRALAVEDSAHNAGEAHLALARIYSQHVVDPQRAVHHIRAALGAAPGDHDVTRAAAELFEKTGDRKAARDAWMRLIDLEAEGGNRAVIWVRVGELSLEDDEAGALHAFEQAFTLVPGYAAALDQLVKLYEKSGQWPRLLEVLDAYRKKFQRADAKSFANISARMGDIYQQRLGKHDLAAKEYQTAAQSDPHTEIYRERLALSLAATPATLGEAARHLRALLRADPLKASTLRALRKVFLEQRARDKAFCVTEVLCALREATPEEQAFVAENRDRVAQTTDVRLPDDEHMALVVDPDERGAVAQLLGAVTSDLYKIYPADLDRYGIEKGEKLTARSPDPLRVLADSLGAVFGMPEYVLFIARAQPLAVAAENGDPLALVVGKDFLRRTPLKDQRFLLARHLSALRMGHHLLKHMDGEELTLFVESVLKAIMPEYNVSELPERAATLAKELRSALSRRAKKALEGPVRALASASSTVDGERVLAAARRTDLRAGIALSNDFEVVVRSLAKEAQVTASLAAPEGVRQAFQASALLRTALEFYVSEDYFVLRHRLGIAIED